MSTISSLELGINLNTSTNLKKTFDHTELSITPPYVTKKFSSLTSKQSSFKTTKRNGKFKNNCFD